MAKFSFDGEITPNFGYVSTFEAVKELIQSYETTSISSFVENHTEGQVGKDAIGSSKTIYWKSSTEKATVAAACLPFDGVPYQIVGTKTLDCHHGKDRRDLQKKKQRKISSDAHGYARKKARKIIQRTKKLDCPARLIIREVLKYPGFKIDDDTVWMRRKASKKLREALDKDDPPKGERRFYIYLPKAEDHGDTHDTGVRDGGCQRLDPRIIEKIHEVVTKHGVDSVAEMEVIIRLYVKDHLGVESPAGNRRFYPQRLDIRNHMNVARNMAQKPLPRRDKNEDDDSESELAVDALFADCYHRQEQDVPRVNPRKQSDKAKKRKSVTLESENTASHLYPKQKRKKPENSNRYAMMAKIKHLEKTIQEQKHLIDQMNTLAHIKLVLSQILPENSYRKVECEIDNHAIVSTT